MRRKYIPTTDSNHAFAVCENVLNRDFHALKGGQKWVSDITYLRTTDGMETSETTIAALKMAVQNRHPHDGLIFHSDYRRSVAGHMKLSI